MHDSQRSGADTRTHLHTGDLVQIVVASLLVLVAIWLGWAGFQLFLASVV